MINEKYIQMIRYSQVSFVSWISVNRTFYEITDFDYQAVTLGETVEHFS